MGVPRLCVEVLSDSTRGHDLLLERERYEAAGVGSYWVVDPETLDLVVWQLEGGRYEQSHQVALRERAVAPTRPFPLRLDLRPA